MTKQPFKQATPEEMRHPEVRILAERIANAVTLDETDGGCDLSAGMFGPAMSALIVELALPKPRCKSLIGCQCVPGSTTQQDCPNWYPA